jgi:serine/threonine-protein kinase
VHELPPALDAFILQMLTKDPEARPGSADALRQQLHRLRRTMLRPTRTQSSSNNGAAVAARAPTPPAAAAPASASPSTEPGAPAVPVSRQSAPATITAPEPTTAPNEAVKVSKVDDAASRRSTTQVPLPPEISPAEARIAGVRSPMRRLVPVGIGVAALLAAGGVMLLRSGNNGTQTPEVTPPPVNTPVTNQGSQTAVPNPPVAPTPNPTVTPTPNPTPNPPVEPVEIPQVATPVVNPPTDTVKPPPETQPVRPTPRPTPSNVPSQAVLLSTIEGLERDLNARAAAGQNMTIARNMLQRIRKEAQDARDAGSRRSVASKIDFWEKSYLKRN